MLRPLILLALLAAACASPAPPVQPGPPTPRSRVAKKPASEPDGRVGSRAVAESGTDDAVIARVGDYLIRESDVGAFVLRYFHDKANEAVTHLVDEYVIGLEARRHGIELPPGLVEAAADDEMAARRKAARMKFGGDVSLERYLRERYGVSVAEHRRDVSRLVRTRLLRDRVIRYSQMSELLLKVLYADFATYDGARRAVSSLEVGADFAILAQEEALRPAVAPPPLSRDEVAPEDFAKSLFALPPGGVTGPVEVEGKGKTSYRVAKVVSRQMAREVDWPSVRNEIEGALRETPLEQWEYVRWARQVREAYRAELLR